MSVTQNKETWELIKRRDIDIPCKDEVFRLIENNLHRIVFVKDHVGVPNVLFVRENGTENIYPYPIILALHVTNETKYPSLEEQLDSFLEKKELVPKKIVQQLETFFKETKQTLYISIGFIETTTPHLRKQMIEIEKDDGKTTKVSLHRIILNGALESGAASSPLDAIRKMKLFPKWYDTVAKMPEEIQDSLQTVANKKMKLVKEQQKTMKQIENLFVHPAMDEKEQEEIKKQFHQLSAYYKELKEEIQTF